MSDLYRSYIVVDVDGLGGETLANVVVVLLAVVVLTVVVFNDLPFPFLEEGCSKNLPCRMGSNVTV